LAHGYEFLNFVGGPPYIRRLIDLYYHIYSSVPGIFLGFGTEEYSSVIFLGTEEYNKTEECTLFSYSDIPCYSLST
jgi:hypothetical protein